MLPAQLLIRRHSRDQYAISFIPPVAIAPAWTPIYSVTLTKDAIDDLAALYGRIITSFTHGATPAPRESLTALGRRLTECFLPEPLRQALNYLPSQLPLSIITNAPEMPWELLCPGAEFLALARPVSRQYLDEQQWDTDRYEQWHARLTAYQTPTPTLLLIANPSNDLDASDVEAERILDVIDALPYYVRCNAIFRGQAKRATVLAELQSGAYSLIHYSGHADTSMTPLLTQNLRLADSALSSAQLVTALGGAPLVFLNACGALQLEAGQELLLAFLRAGARSCIGALWPISDLVSADFSATFYQRLLSGHSVGAALWQARCAAYAMQPNDPTWAAFVLYGDPSWQPVPPPMQSTYLATVLIVRLPPEASLAATVTNPAPITIERLQQWATVISEWGGVVWHAGVDGLWATFGLPEAQEDQVQRAVQAAWALRMAHSPVAGAQQDAPPVTIALATGSVTVYTATHPMVGALLLGPTVSAALALSDRAGADEIWAEQSVYQASKELFAWTPHDRQRYRLVSIQSTELTTAASIPFIGRQSELDSLLAHWRRCQQRQQRQVIGVVGEAGIGKTRLIHALRQALQDQPDGPSAHWIDARCPAHLSTSPFALLRALLAQGLGVPITAPVEQWRHALTHLFTTEANIARQIDLVLLEQSLGLCPAFTEGRDVAEDVRRAQLVAVLKTLLIHLCQAAPLVLAIDDIYYADEPSLDIVNQLIESLDGLPLCWLVLYRREWLPPWANKRRCHTLDMDELDPEERAELLAALLPADTPATIQTAILERAGGNPLYLEQLARVVRDSASFSGGDAFPISPARLPSTLRLTFQVRAARLPVATQSILKLAAVAGTPFDPTLLATVLHHTGEAIHLESALRDLVSRDFLRSAADQYVFAHPLLAEVIYAELPTVERQTFHRRLADALVEQSVTLPTLVAWHRLRSVTRPQADGSWSISPPPFSPHYLTQVLDALLTASEAAWQSYANREVLRWCQAGLELLPHLATTSASTATVALHSWLGKAWGRLGEFATAIDHLQQAFDRCLTLTEALQQSGFLADPQLQAADLARQIGRIRMRQGHYTESLTWLTRGQALATRRSDAQALATQAHIAVHTGAVYHGQGNYEQAIVHYQAGIDLAEALPNTALSALAEGYNGLGVVWLEQGQVARAITFFQRALQIWRMLGNLYEATRVQENLGNAYFNQSDWPIAQQHYQESLAFWRRIEERNHIPYSLLNLGGVHLGQGRWAEAETCYTQALELWTTVGEVRMAVLAHINLGHLALARKDRSLARNHVKDALTMLDEQAVDIFRAEAYATMAELQLQENAPDQTLIWGKQALTIAQRLEQRLEQGVAYRLLGQAHQQRGEFGLAQENLQQSIAQLTATPNRYELGRTWVALAVLEQATGATGQAQTRLTQAAGLFHELGAQPDCELVQRILQGGDS